MNDALKKNYEIPKADMIDGLRKGLEVICAFNDDTTRLTQSELAQRLDLSRSAARRYLMTLTALGYMATDGKAYWLTPKVMRLGHSYLASARLPRTVLPVLQQMTNVIGESTNLAVLEGADAVYISRASAAKLLVTMIEPGTRLPAHASAAGRILLAYLDDAALSQWLSKHRLIHYTTYTITELSTLKKELRKIRRQGFCLAENQYEIGIRGLAVPLVNSNNEVIAALGTSMATSALSPEETIKRLTPVLQAGAAQLRTQL